jgi:hypothetical protein
MTSEHEHERAAPEIEQEVDALRSDLGGLVDELDRRRHEMTDVRLQLRRHSRAVALGLGIAALSVVGRMVALRRRRAHAQRFTARAANLARILALLSQEDPRQVRRAVERRRDTTALGLLAKAGATLAPRLLRSPSQP